MNFKKSAEYHAASIYILLYALPEFGQLQRTTNWFWARTGAQRSGWIGESGSHRIVPEHRNLPPSNPVLTGRPAGPVSPPPQMEGQEGAKHGAGEKREAARSTRRDTKTGSTTSVYARGTSHVAGGGREGSVAVTTRDFSVKWMVQVRRFSEKNRNRDPFQGVLRKNRIASINRDPIWRVLCK